MDAHGLALDALLTAVPFAAVAAIAAFGGYLDRRDDAVVALQALLWGVALVLLIVSCEVRSNAIHGVPPLAVSSLVACLGVFAIKAGVAVAPYVRRLAELRPRSRNGSDLRCTQPQRSSAEPIDSDGCSAQSETRRQNGNADAAERATSISGCTAKNEPTVTTRQIATPALRARSRGGEPPAGAICSSTRSRRNIERTTAR